MKITVNRELVFEGNNKESLLESAKKSNITFNHSCLNGRCSECKVKVITGEYFMPKSQQGLSEDEVNHGYCLSCITQPLSALTLDEVNFFEGTLPAVRTIPAKIHKLEFLSKEIAHLQLRTPPNNQLTFIPGQYVDLIINGIKRSYSISSIPSDHTINFLIKNYSGGKFSNYLFNEAKENDLLRIEGPKGTYILPSSIENDIVFISTGTGIAPNLSMVNHIIHKNIFSSKQLTIIHGQRFAADHVYDFQSLLEGVKIIKVNSREKKEGFAFGYVQDSFLAECFDLRKTKVYACGNSEMIRELKKLSLANGLKESNFKSEIFINSN